VAISLPSPVAFRFDSRPTWIPPAGEETRKFPCNTPPFYGKAARVSTENENSDGKFRSPVDKGDKGVNKGVKSALDS